MDIQFIGEESGVLNRYISGYISKMEREHIEKLMRTVNRNNSLRGQLWTMGVCGLAEKEIGANEAADRLLGYCLHRADTAVHYIGNVGFPYEETRALKTGTEQVGLHDDEPLEAMYKENFTLDHYPRRGEEYRNLSLYECFRWYGPYRCPLPSNANMAKFIADHEEEIEDGEIIVLANPGQDKSNGYLKRRSKPFIVRMNWPYTTTDRDREKMYAMLLQLFKPYFKRNELAQEFADSATQFEDAFRAAVKRGEISEDGLRMWQLRDKRWNEAVAAAERKKERERKRVAGELDNDGDHDDGADDALADAHMTDLPLEIADDEVLKDMVGTLNSEQRAVFDQTVSIIKAQYKYEERLQSTPGLGIKPDTAAYMPSAEVMKCHPPDEKLDGGDCKQFIHHVSGPAGTGKSRLIAAIEMWANAFWSQGQAAPRRCVRLAAPTGIAAANIGGMTCHQLFGLPVQIGGNAPFLAMKRSSRKRKEIKDMLRHCRLLIIDEMSMISNVTFTEIDHRLRDVLGEPTLPFGGLHVLLVGDLLQLPPVNGHFIFQKLSKWDRKCFHSCVAPENPWVDKGVINLGYSELTKQQRQIDDKEYGEMLNRLRLGNLNEDDVALLQSLLILDNDDDSSAPWAKTEEFEAEVKDAVKNIPSRKRENSRAAIVRALHAYEQIEKRTKRKPVVIVPLNDTADAINRLKLYLDGITTRELVAEDEFGNKISTVKGKRKKTSGKTATVLNKARKTGGIEKVLVIGEGARVMLRRNMSITNRLCNGSCGTVVRFEEDGPPGRRRVTGIHVAFDDKQKPLKEGEPSPPLDELVTTLIEQVEVQFPLKQQSGSKTTAGLMVKRRQFPLTLCYAVTAHRSQGLTLDDVILDLGEDCFERAQVYVMLSRCRKRSNVNLMAFDPSTILCDKWAVEEYKKLRRKATNDPPLEEITAYNIVPEWVKQMGKEKGKKSRFGKKGALQPLVNDNDEKGRKTEQQRPAAKKRTKKVSSDDAFSLPAQRASRKRRSAEAKDKEDPDYRPSAAAKRGAKQLARRGRKRKDDSDNETIEQLIDSCRPKQAPSGSKKQQPPPPPPPPSSSTAATSRKRPVAATRIATRPPPPKKPVEVLPNEGFFRFENSKGIACYANTTLTMLLQCKELMDAAACADRERLLDDQKPLLDALCELYFDVDRFRRVHSAWKVRNAVPANDLQPYSQTGMEDSHEMMVKIMDKLPDEMRRMCTHDKSIVITCQECYCPTVELTNDRDGINDTQVFMVSKGKHLPRGEFTDYFVDDRPDSERFCETCQCMQKHLVQELITLRRHQRYLFIYFHLFDQSAPKQSQRQRLKEDHLPGLPANSVISLPVSDEQHGTKAVDFRAIAAQEYLEQRLHYRSWIPGPSEVGWRVISDDRQIGVLVPTLPAHLENINCIVFERIFPAEAAPADESDED